MQNDTAAILADQDEATFEPSEADLAWYAERSREFNARQRDRQIADGPTFVQRLYDEANTLLDDADPVRAWIGGQVAKLADLARFLEATSPDSFEDRRDCLLDAAEARGRERMSP